MPTYKVLAQSAPSAATATTLYTATNATIVSTLQAANRGSTQDAVRIAVRPAGATLANEHYIAFDVPLAANAVLSLQGGITLANTDVITIYSTSGNTSFSAFGSEAN
jgi:glucose-6-phosphate dehydrogenase assembly protein OpcA